MKLIKLTKVLRGCDTFLPKSPFCVGIFLGLCGVCLEAKDQNDAGDVGVDRVWRPQFSWTFVSPTSDDSIHFS